ncbi:hypothetical protein GO755_12835 [Spirosoma sp. HMF4905]|uniref:Polymerase nucleotidyl transferase domain-containing protein n=1 Tax=Spirosoma arboris TaxID=2682092 RepID=A0A7K1SAW9_9BACT|nr:hypothetical protein [Spirosoma arboris]MVM30920.1 hypothetical protein [Spirosoma arboris]
MAITQRLDWHVKIRDVLNILIYSDIFQYPLTRKEIFERGKLDDNELDICLSALLHEERIFLIDGYYSLRNDPTLITLRSERNVRANNYIKKARVIAKVLARFPFIRAVFLSGSISKNCVDKKGDVDFFIITESKRLWLAQFFCSMFKRTILLNRTKYFCYNYIIDNKHLLIDERSIYTAFEIKTLIPLLGYDYYKRMLNENSWASIFFPKYPVSPDNDVIRRQSKVQKILEYLLNNSLGEYIDNWLLNYSLRKRKKRLASKFFENPVYYTNLQRHVAKSHTNDHYPNIIKEYHQKTQRY